MKHLLLVLMFPALLGAQQPQWQAKVKWDPPKDVVAGTKIYERTGNAYKLLIDVAQPTNEAQLSLTVGAHTIAGTFYLASGLESLKSNELVIPALPDGPVNLRFEIVITPTIQK